MAKIDIADGPGGDAVQVWKLRSKMAKGVVELTEAAYQHSQLPVREREVARMRIAQINGCLACLNFRAPSVMEQGVTEELYAHVADYSVHDDYSSREKLAIEFAERFALDHHSLDDAFFARLRVEFADDEILDLTICVGAFLGLGRMLRVLGIDEACDIDPGRVAPRQA
jgi:AhpD family alkylhydroperoxidase